jgi:hypothetical protein
MSQTKVVSLIVPNSFEIPHYLLKATPEQLEHALRLADALLEAGIHFHQNFDIKLLKEKIRDLESTTVESVREEALRIAKAEMRAEVNGKDILVSELRRQVLNKEKDYEDLKCEKQKLNEKLSTKEGKVEELQGKVEELQSKLQERIAIQSNSSKRGQEGEKDFEILTTNMKPWILESVGKTKESTDFCASIHSLEVRFEVKNHETLVPYSKNVDKFERDMKVHPTTKVGVFVALTARIEKMEDSITLRWTEDKQLLIFIPQFLYRDMTYTYDIIESLIRTMRHWRPYFETKDTSKDIEILTEKLTTTIANIQILDKEITMMCNEHSVYNTKMESRYAALKSIVTTTLSSLTGKEEEEPKKKRKTNKKTATE